MALSDTDNYSSVSEHPTFNNRPEDLLVNSILKTSYEEMMNLFEQLSLMKQTQEVFARDFEKRFDLGRYSIWEGKDYLSFRTLILTVIRDKDIDEHLVEKVVDLVKKYHQGLLELTKYKVTEGSEVFEFVVTDIELYGEKLYRKVLLND